ncbi:DUF3685 domain-containing protein [Synechococcus sp. MU1642]|uniref:DUF3685 domain-containing protein n=1 Tax=Synechococcus sp. MU1642 TaxID=2508348 RepID=UPI001CF81F4B|nr:DUF3685 domain-containing protein [Synechococcus sp. MU1642]MCB4406285.1 DUF3685 domain-containing protein [Synechococcus sp. MU1642]
MLLLAPDLFGESLALKLTSARTDWEVVLRPERLKGSPALVIWSIDTVASLSAIQQELFALQERWQPAPVLLLLPSGLLLSREQLLELPAAGLLQNVDAQGLQNAIETLLQGGRDIRLEAASETQNQGQTMGLGQWLLVSGLQQVSRDLRRVEALLNPPPEQPLLFLLLQGRRRELRFAKGLLLWLWGPLQMGLEHAEPLAPSASSNGLPTTTAISLRERNAVAVWDAIRDRIDASVQAGLTNSTGRLLAIEGLHPDRRRELLLALLQQLDQVLQRLRSRQDSIAIAQSWDALQPELRQQALTALAGSYVQIPCDGELQPVVASLLSRADLTGADGELPDPTGMLAPLVADQPMLVNGLLLPADDPRAFLQLETLVSNWLVRTAELIGAELLDACGDWPELRRYLLRDPLLATRELDRLRNRLNTQLRWADWVERPIQLYESQRTLFQLRSGRIEPLLLTEPRDKELNQLGWWQRQVALLLEARDALAPQVQALVRRIGDLAVILLTQVLGRAIGLVGRGIAQGMGRSFGRG